ncbi:Heterokaryon incompatibility protein 6, OR allele [Lachnellula arida]|uniref:Heterokaryon incompatibility protein 6, OR allele n=1 Tax=Lachnellula arida TaxID=1316785 RepID=A0A8T9BBW4_9HELO|nr:Heterokaryon incompatibility protein 6, OR allele [Lachnellula arida]
MSGNNTNLLLDSLAAPILDRPQFELAQIDGATSARTLGVDRLNDRLLPENKIRIWASTKKIPVPTKSDDKGRLYRPIVDPHEIRVLEIKSGAYSEKLRGSLHHCSVEYENETVVNAFVGTVPTRYALSMDDLTTPVWYTALSYTWGAPVFDRDIECNGYEKMITASLDAALRNLRKKDRSVVMWIDQICIDQENNEEKQQQIPLMAKIYRHALNTAIWIGDPSPGSDSAMRFLENIYVRLQFIENDIDPADFERMSLPKPDSEIWQALWDLLSRPWFTRLWIIQEVILSEDARVVCGDSFITWDQLALACIQLSTCGISRWLQLNFSDSAVSSGRGDVCQLAVQLDAMKMACTSNSARDLFSLLIISRNAQCYDSRDKIYGLLGVCSKRDSSAVRTSYAPDFTAAQLYQDMAVYYLSTGSHGGLLTIVLTSVDHDSSDLPSWVPDWRRPRRTTALGCSESTPGAQSIYNANGRNKPAKNKIDFTFNGENKNELRPRGIFVDTVVKTSNLFIDPDLTYLNPTTNNKTLLEFFNFISQLEHYPAPNTVFSAFWHSLVAGKDGSGHLKCPLPFAEIISLLLDACTNQSPSLPGQTYSARQQRPKGRGKLELANLASRTPGQTFQKVRAAMKVAVKNRRLGITEKGYVGLIPEYGKVGDRVYVLDGCHMPFLLRVVDEVERFRLIGDCYVYGIMDGEFVKEDIDFKQIILLLPSAGHSTESAGVCEADFNTSILAQDIRPTWSDFAENVNFTAGDIED